MNTLATAEKFFSEIQDLCRLVEKEFVARFHEFNSVPFSDAAALTFSENLILCPTLEASQMCVRRDLVGALSFVLALQGIQLRLEKDGFDLPASLPENQTCFYLLACAVRDYLASLRPQPA